MWRSTKCFPAGVFRSGTDPRYDGCVPEFEARVEVSYLPGIADPAGATVERALPALGYDNVTHVRIAKCIRLVVEASDEVAARAQVEDLCRRLLTNPVIEAFDVTLAALVP